MAEDFEGVYSEHFTGVYKYVLSLCRDDLLAEEVTQETFFKAMMGMDKFNGSCTLYVWARLIFYRAKNKLREGMK